MAPAFGCDINFLFCCTWNDQTWESTRHQTSLRIAVNVTDNIVYEGLLRKASGKQQWPQYRHRYPSLAYKPSTDNTNAHIYRRTGWKPHVISLAGISGLLDLQTHFMNPFSPHLVSWEPDARPPLTWRIQPGLDVKTRAAAGSEEYTQRLYCPQGRVCERDEGLITAQQLCNSPPWYSTRAENLTRLAQSKDGLVFLT